MGDRRGRARLRDERVPERKLAGLSVRRVVDGSRRLGVYARAGNEAWRSRAREYRCWPKTEGREKKVETIVADSLKNAVCLM